MRRLLMAVALLTSACAQQKAAKEIDADELARLLERKEVFFLDVRQPDEIAKLGSVKGYVNIPMDQLERRMSEIPKDKLIVTI
ncbi:MAG: rhodanese-like domain-containing protein [Bryobacteraceae bacterium]|nr:rhodanese-like domain-containing protein [Bryobacteraceae bacterium]